MYLFAIGYHYETTVLFGLSRINLNATMSLNHIKIVIKLQTYLPGIDLNSGAEQNYIIYFNLLFVGKLQNCFGMF